MLKGIGAILLIAGGVILGQTAVRCLDHRVTTLRSVVQALELMEHEMEFHLPFTMELMRETARRCAQPASGFLQTCANGVETGEYPVSQIWQQAARENLPALKKGDMDALMTVGSVLGRYDADSQRQTLSGCRECLSGYLSDAVEERRRQGRVYGTLSVTVGVFLVILLL